jgi:S-adenosylmethionine:tRNA ribosyltransferase-isomerase
MSKGAVDYQEYPPPGQIDRWRGRPDRRFRADAKRIESRSLMTSTILPDTGLRLDAFDFELPEALIAQHPAPSRTASRLLRVDAAAGAGARPRLSDLRFADLPGLVGAGDLLVLNDTRVIPARLLGVKDSGGRVEALVERVTGEHEALAMVRASKAPKLGSRLYFDAHAATVRAREGEFYRLAFDDAVHQVLERVGRIPLPPYITHAPEALDRERYQTVYARVPGSVAAPTAGLHFDDALLAKLGEHGVDTTRITLHVGAGTFQPVRTERVAEHRMHSERYVVPPAAADAIAAARARGGRVIAVGTTALRTLESAASEDGSLRAQAGETALFITPGYRFRVVDRLITNFHLPRSTLLMLVCAFAGTEAIRAAYAHAIAHRYRFFSYGDAMILDRAPDAGHA